MVDINAYALKILADNGCDCYTYGGEDCKNILEDLHNAFPDGMPFPYVEVANAILAISKPRPIIREQWRVCYDTEHFCDCFTVKTLLEAKARCLELLTEWMEQAIADGASEEIWDTMIDNFCVWVDEYNPMHDEYEWFDSPSDEELISIGWVYWSERAEKPGRK